MSTDTAAGRNGAVNVLGISGSLRKNSHNTTLLRGAAALAAPTVQLSLWKGLADVPPFNEDHEDEPPEAVRAMRADIEAADALLISTPEYNTTVPGQLKNALDWASRPDSNSVLLGKPIAVAGASPSDYGAAWSQEALRKSVASCGAKVVDSKLCVSRADEAFGHDDQLVESALRAELIEVLAELVDLVNAIRRTANDMVTAR